MHPRIAEILSQHSTVIDRIVAFEALASQTEAEDLKRVRKLVTADAPLEQFGQAVATQFEAQRNTRTTFDDLRFILVSACLAQEPQALLELVEGLSSSNPRTRLCVARAIGSHLNARRRSALPEGVKGLDPGFVRCLLEALGNELDASVTEELVSQLIDAHDWTTKAYFEACGQNHYPRLVNAIEGSETGVPKLFAIILAGQLKLRSAVRPLIRALKEAGPTQPTLASNAVIALERITGKRFMWGNSDGRKWERWWGKRGATGSGT